MWFKELRLEKIKSYDQFIEKTCCHTSLFRLASFLSFFTVSLFIYIFLSGILTEHSFSCTQA